MQEPRHTDGREQHPPVDLPHSRRDRTLPHSPRPSVRPHEPSASSKECAMRQGALPAGLLAAGILLTACGGSPTTAGTAGSAPDKNPYAAYESLTGQDRTDKLVADAKEEGGTL